MITNYLIKSRIALALFALLSISTLNAQISRLGGKTSVAYEDNYQRASAGYSHYLEIKNGKLFASGSNNFGQLGIGTISAKEIAPIQVGTDENWVSVAGGENFSLAIKADGTLWAWGYNNRGQLGTGTTTNTNEPTQVGTDDNWISIAAGSRHSLAIKSDGTLWTWGYNYFGQLGNGTTSGFSAAFPDPAQVGTATNWVAISAGYNHNLAIQADGSLWAWGENTLGQVGTGTASSTGISTPTAIATDSHWKKIDAGGFFSTAIKTDGTLWAWGDNYYGEIANGNTTTQPQPTQIGTDLWKNVSAGRNHVMALKPDGSVWVWGDELGEYTNQATVPTEKTEMSGTVQISAGDSFSLALNSNGELYSWGKNDLGQLGNNTNTTLQSIPTYNGSTSSEILAIASGHGFNTYTLHSNGSLKGWGDNTDGQLLDGTSEDKYAPINLTAAGTDNIAIANGYGHVMVLKDNGSIYGWGDNTLGGQVGTGSGNSEPLPVALQGNDWISVTSGTFTTGAIKADGTLWMWGNNGDGEIGNGNMDDQETPIQIGTDLWNMVAIGGSHTIAIKEDGTLWGWGRNYAGEAGAGETTDEILVPTQIGTENDWVYVSAASMSSFAIKADGSLWGWGAASMGQLGLGMPIPTKQVVPTQIGNGNFIQAKLGNWSGVGLQANGTAQGWGNLNMVFGELGMGNNDNYPTPTLIPSQENIIQISAAQAHRSLLKADKTSICTVGRNYNGELGIGETETTTTNAYRCDIASNQDEQGVVVKTENNVAPEINEVAGTLQLIATVNPAESSQAVVWTIESGFDFASVDANGLVTAIADGSVVVRATSVENDTLFGEITITINQNLSIDDLVKNTYKLYPNPTSGIATIESLEPIKEILIFNMVGQQISKSTTSEINISGIENGIYFAQIHFENGKTATQKLVKK